MHRVQQTQVFFTSLFTLIWLPFLTKKGFALNCYLWLLRCDVFSSIDLVDPAHILY